STGAITGGLGVDAETAGTGSVVVGANAGITGLTGSALLAGAGAGAVTVASTGGLAQPTGGTVIAAGNSGAGAILVKTDAVKQNDAATFFGGIFADSTGSGTVTVLTNGAVTGSSTTPAPGTGTGIIASNGTGTGAVTVTAGGAVTGFANGIDAGNGAVTGSVTVTAQHGV